VAANIQKDVDLLGPIDLLLLHWPCAGANAVEDTLAAWQGLEAALNAGMVLVFEQDFALEVLLGSTSLLCHACKTASRQPASRESTFLPVNAVNYVALRRRYPSHWRFELQRKPLGGAAASDEGKACCESVWPQHWSTQQQSEHYQRWG
jgi:hypothetical protein